MQVSPQKMESLEWLSIFLNNGLLLIGMPLLGWAFFDILFLHWLELPAACLLWLAAEWSLAFSFKKAIAKRLMQGLGLLLLTIGWSSFSLYWAADASGLNPEAGPSIWGQLPSWLWANDLFWLSLLFFIAYLAPVVILWRRHIPPLRDQLPVQSQIMSHWVQWLANPLWLFLIWIIHRETAIENAFIWVLLLVTCKTLTEVVLLLRILRKRRAEAAQGQRGIS